MITVLLMSGLMVLAGAGAFYAAVRCHRRDIYSPVTTVWGLAGAALIVVGLNVASSTFGIGWFA